MDPVVFEQVAIDQIDEFVANPRRRKSPKFERIKASVRAVGVQQPIHLIRRGGRFGLSYGGHTRLRVLKELSEETGDSRFTKVPAIISADRPDIDLIIGHFQENELRSKLSFGERALIAKDLSEEFVAEQPMSQRELAKKLSERGIPVAQSEISTLWYAATRLYPIIPHALLNDLTRAGVRYVERLEHLFRTLWQNFGAGEETFDETFEQLLRRRDLEWSGEALRDDLEVELAQSAEESLQTIRFAADGDSNKAVAKVLPPEDSPAARVIETLPKHFPCKSQIDHLRMRNYEAARTLASAYGLTSAIVQMRDNGPGYLVTDFPDPALEALTQEDGLDTVNAVWWILLSYCDLIDIPRALLDSYYEPDSVFHAVACENNVRLLEAIVPPHHLNDIPHLLRCMDREGWRAYQDLSQGYRELHDFLDLHIWGQS